MITILLIILKFLGILLLILLMTAIVLLLLVLFVPIRYRISLQRKEEDGVPVTVELKVTWLIHLLNAAFSYPEAAFLRVRLLCFTLFRSDKKKEKPSDSNKKEQKTNPQTESERKQKTSDSPQKPKHTESPESKPKSEPEPEPKSKSEPEPEPETDKKKSFFAKVKEFFLKLLSLFQNIRYTIAKICDKIKHIVNNIQYYMKILKSDTFSRAWTLCSGQAFSLLKSVLPGKFIGSLVIGTGDPASTGQVLAIYGMLYPLLGNHINVTPDFERQIIEGELFMKGKITVFKGLKTAWKIYFNRDLRRLIQLFKREAA